MENWLCYPVLKKGSPTEKSNYRLVIGLSVLSKVLEKIVCEQITKLMEDNGLLPQNQHSFRAGRSTMSALAAIQQEWATNSEEKLITGALLSGMQPDFGTKHLSQ